MDFQTTSRIMAYAWLNDIRKAGAFQQIKVKGWMVLIDLVGLGPK